MSGVPFTLGSLIIVEFSAEGCQKVPECVHLNFTKCFSLFRIPIITDDIPIIKNDILPSGRRFEHGVA
jgi:hypothetical protein